MKIEGEWFKNDSREFNKNVADIEKSLRTVTNRNQQIELHWDQPMVGAICQLLGGHSAIYHGEVPWDECCYMYESIKSCILIL